MAKKALTPSTWRIDVIVSVCAMLVSIATFGLFWYQTQVMRDQAKASVYPHLSIGRGYGADPRYFKLFVKNLGIGPAFIKSMEISYKGKVYTSKVYPESCLPMAMLIELIPKDKKFLPLSVGSSVPFVLPAGSEEVFLALREEGTEAHLDTLVNIFEEAEIKMCYASVYKDYWIVSKDGQPQECKNCEQASLFKPTK